MFSSLFFYSRLFVQHFPGAASIATYSFVGFWLVATAFNLETLVGRV